ncbi:GGDEF domain-containing protein [Sphingopyxis sp. MWB1]|uniref:GGDEF domain-containing protein n=1 Tax=Sphingopyxis sp. MWB1 TaxID=1537715 RepID=UPI000A9BC2D9|nr:GGDEF domain-containing protein [Sphingopyxis sp. MWB1]
MLAVLILFAPFSARATSLHVNDPLCHAVSSRTLTDQDFSTLAFQCSGTPRGYQEESLWLRADLTDLPEHGNTVALMVRQTRTDRLAVAFVYADGAVHWDHVAQGAFGNHWRAGGQIMFEAPERSAPLTHVMLRFDGLAGHEFLNARLLPREEAAMQSATLAAAVGAALTLLLVGCIYCVSLAVAVRRDYLAWQAGWSATMLLWGAIWSQVHLALFPGLAGSVSAQLATFLACLAVALATLSAVKAVAVDAAPAPLRLTALLLGIGVGLAGVPLAMMRTGELGLLSQILGFVILADLAIVILYLAWAWRRGSVEARDFLAAWGLPMAALAFVHLVDVGHGFWGGGSQLPVLLAAAWQALWLAASATRRFARLRIERDHARAAEAQAQRLARHDPLTGLLNRRGFTDNVAPLLDAASAQAIPVALLLVDVDRFKSINDAFGHEAGDEVLCGIAACLARWEGEACTVARLGGEEFGLLVIGLDGMMLDGFAESVRRAIAECDHGAVLGEHCVTASIGVAEIYPASDFQGLYRLADAALYDAKRAGRNRVRVRRGAACADGTGAAASLAAPMGALG